MRILITGAAGFIGSTLADRLVARGDEVVGLDAFDETLYPAADKRRHLEGLLGHPRFVLAEGDLVDPALLDTVMAQRPDAVVHAAALAGVRPSLAEPLRWARVNVDGTLQVMEAARRHGVERIVLVSTSSVYEPGIASAAHGLREDDPADVQASPYGATKRAAELLAASWARVYGLRIACVRLFSVYGPRQRPDMAIHRFVRALLEGRPLPVYGDGSTERDYTYVDDVVDGLERALDRTATLSGLRTWNLGASRAVPLSRLIGILEDATGRRARIERLPLPPGDVALTLADSTRARDELGWMPQVTVEEGVRRFVEWMRAPEASFAKRAVR